MNFTIDVNVKLAPETLKILQSLVKQISLSQPTPAQTKPPTQITAVPTTPTPTPTSTPEQPAQAQAQAPEQPSQTVPTAAQSYTMEQLAVAATQLVDAGRREELVQLLQQFGVEALTALPKEQYGAFATALRQMGAKV